MQRNKGNEAYFWDSQANCIKVLVAEVDKLSVVPGMQWMKVEAILVKTGPASPVKHSGYSFHLVCR